MRTPAQRQRVSANTNRSSQNRTAVTRRSYGVTAGRNGYVSPVTTPIGSPRSNTRVGMVPYYDNPFARLDQDPSYRSWTDGNRRTPRAFDSGFSRNGRYNDYRRGYRPFGTRINIGFSRTCWPSYHRSSWPHRYTTYLLPTFYPYGYGSYFFGRDYWPDVEYNTYETNYYLGDSDSQTGTGVTYSQPVGTSVTVLPATPQQAATHRQLAAQAFAGGDFPLARREYVRAMLAEPEDPELIMLYGFAHFATGDYLVAALAIRKALQADPTLVDHPIALDQLYSDDSALYGQLADLDAHLTSQPDDVDARFLAGFARYAAGDPASAQPYFLDCVTERPDDLLHMVMRDAAIRADLMQQAAQSEADTGDTVIPESPSTSPERIEAMPVSF